MRCYNAVMRLFRLTVFPVCALLLATFFGPPFGDGGVLGDVLVVAVPALVALAIATAINFYESRQSRP
jgi:hypothetical protein